MNKSTKELLIAFGLLGVVALTKMTEFGGCASESCTMPEFCNHAQVAAIVESALQDEPTRSASSRSVPSTTSLVSAVASGGNFGSAAIGGSLRVLRPV